MRQARTDREIATFRFNVIAPLLDASLSAQQKRRVRSSLRCRESTWPNGAMKPIGRTTISRWIAAYRERGFAGLALKRRKDRGVVRSDIEKIVDYAIALLLEQPSRSIFLVSQFAARQFPGKKFSRTTLARHLKAHPSYVAIQRLRGRIERLRGRYEAAAPHESWQLDGKGPFRVCFEYDEVRKIHILTILDDYSRAVLAAIVTRAEDSVSAVRVFQAAVRRYGLPSRMQFDRGSAFDGNAFRDGIAHLGVHRNFVRAKDPRAQGKIEAFNKSLGRWFIDELAHEKVRDEAHLQELLDAFIALVYQRHRHRELRSTPEARLANQVSKRLVSEQDLARAFFTTVTAKSDRTTGVVRLANGRFVVPPRFAGVRAKFRFDPLRPHASIVTDSGEIVLEAFAIKPLAAPRVDSRGGGGHLERIREEFQGRQRTNAEPAFGLSEVLCTIATLAERRIPENERDATMIAEFWKKYGPLEKSAFLSACDAVKRSVGSRRALDTYLDHLARRIERSRASKKQPKESS